jgi:hypothetical protein
MGLFGIGSSYSRIGSGADGAAARKTVEDIGRSLETELQDTPGEYFVLQAAGMLFACEFRACEGVQPVRSMQESLARAAHIMDSLEDSASTKQEVLEARAHQVHEQFHAAVRSGVRPPLIVGYLNDYLHHVDNGYLRRRAGSASARPMFPVHTLSRQQEARRWWQFWK